MNRRQFLSSASLAAAAQQPKFPNVIILLTDDQGYGDLSCHGNPVLKTPNMDKLHAESVRFTDFHSAPMCTPTRGQLLTGQDALRNGATSVTAGRALVRRGIPIMPGIFKASGYSTGMFGKWHIGDTWPFRPIDRGFQEAKYFHGFGMSSAVEFDNDYSNGFYMDKGERKRFTGYCTDFWFDQAMAWMKKQKAANQPFFCYLPTNTPHGPAWVDPKYAAPYKGSPANFFGMIANLDENIGKLESFLATNGLRDNTILIFMTDNGGTAGVSTFNAGMRGRKSQIYNGGHRVPCFVRWPAANLKPRDIAEPAQMQDILPTLIDLCALKKPDAKFDGRSLAPLLKGSDKFPSRMLVVQYGQLLTKWDSYVIWGKWRLVGEKELYDIVADPGEMSNAIAANHEIALKMRAHYEKWWTTVEPTLREFVPISIGGQQHNPVPLCCADWQEVYCDNPNSVLSGAGGPQGGQWGIQVEQSGDYEIQLSRWPFQMKLPLNAPCPASKKTYGQLPEGKALPIAKAQLRIAGRQLEMKTKPAATSVSFRLKLSGNTKTKLHAWFQDAEGKDLCGSYYATVRRI